MPDSRENKFVRDRGPLKLVVERRSVALRPHPKKDPWYFVTHFKEILECGHEQEHRWPDLGIARRRECKKCAEAVKPKQKFVRGKAV